MSAVPGSDARTSKGKRVAPSNPSGTSGPTTFFIRSEKDMERDTQRGRKASRAPVTAHTESYPRAVSTGEMEDSKYGVQSLADTISSAFTSENSLSRTNSIVTEPGDDAVTDPNALTVRKRKAGNPVHPRIMATGHRIISAERAPTQASLAASPVSLRSSESPFRTHLQRRGSGASSINLNSQPLTPLKMSPRPESAMPSTPRSGSPKSFRLSDEEGSLADETGSQAIHSSSGDEDEGGLLEGDKVSSMPQLVMPSIAIPTRRPFTERGKRIGRLRVMVVGPNGVGKTSLIQSVLRSCEDVVHVDPVNNATLSFSVANGNDAYPTVEVCASTRLYPSWWTDLENRRMMSQRKSVGDGVLERNLCFIDTPGVGDEREVQLISQYVEAPLRRIAMMERMSDTELVGMLSGEGGTQIDAVLWLFDTEHLSSWTKSDPQNQLLSTLCGYTNVIPLIGRGDLADQDRIADYKHAVRDIFSQIDAEPYLLNSTGDLDSDAPQEPYVVSSALSDDAETMDASVLMSSQYLQPLVPSELGDFVDSFFQPENAARMRHLSATKFLLWRQENPGQHIDLQKQMLLKAPRFEATPSSISSTGSGRLPEDPSKVLVPCGSSSYFRSASPSATSESSAPNAIQTSAYALARYNEQTQQTTEPFRQVRLAKWAQDLQRGLHNERKRYQQMYATCPPSDWTSSNDEAEKSEHNPLVTTQQDSTYRPARGTLGGAVSVFDPRDPLGVLAFSQAFRRRGWFVLQVAGGCGVIGAVVFWVVRNWVEVQGWCGGIGEPVMAPQAVAVPPPPKGVMEAFGVDWRDLLGLAR